MPDAPRACQGPEEMNAACLISETSRDSAFRRWLNGFDHRALGAIDGGLR
jgi:hypothetical protein